VIYDKRGRREATKMRGMEQGYSLNDNNKMQVVDRRSSNGCCWFKKAKII